LAAFILFTCAAVLAETPSLLPLSIASPGKGVEWTFKRNARAVGDTLVLEIPDDRAAAAAMLTVEAAGLEKGKPLYFMCDVKVENLHCSPHIPNSKYPWIKIDQDGKSPVWKKIRLAPTRLGKWALFVDQYTSRREGKTLRISIHARQRKGAVYIRDPRLTYSFPVGELSWEKVFPFKVGALPGGASIEIDPRRRKRVDPLILGVNNPMNSRSAGGGYATKLVAELIATVRPPHLRFPGGTVANWYDWETDRYACPDFSAYPAGIQDKLKWVEHGIQKGYRFNAAEFTALAREHSIRHVEVFNIFHDPPEKSVRRLLKRKRDNVAPAWIELGNENYSAHQFGGAVKNIEQYVRVTREVASALKRADPAAMVAVNVRVPRDGDWQKDAWNGPLVRETYFDGVALHPYLHAVRHFLFDDYGLREVFGAHAVMRRRIESCAEAFPGKKILLSEWDLHSFGNEPAGFDSMALTLGVADAFLAILDAWDRGVVAEAANHRLIDTPRQRVALYTYDWKTRKVYKRQKGVLFELIWGVFRDAELLSARTGGPVIQDPLDPDIDGLQCVTARAVRGEDGRMRVFCVNKLPQETELGISVMGDTYRGRYSRLTYADRLYSTAFCDLGKTPEAVSVARGRGSPVVLPAGSVNIVTLLDRAEP